MFYLHVQDFVDAYIGPFPSRGAAQAHYEWCRDVRGDGAALISISKVLPPAGEFIQTPDEDLKM